MGRFFTMAAWAPTDATVTMALPGCGHAVRAVAGSLTVLSALRGLAFAADPLTGFS
ncbi:hypothetical protein [Saccharothrix sp. ST-888]|uniref:hypothetical protein n=1 Tax=Saccharothrix sp. ST-888 TaxID=1427391 RepID=UPI0018CC869A|nr:hypothetical protein [Saccharothrix sp. ST-888]